jgi:hypothetical protein
MKQILALILILFLTGCFYKSINNMASRQVDSLDDLAKGKVTTTTLSENDRTNVGECITKYGDAYGVSCAQTSDCELKLLNINVDAPATCEPSLYRKWNIQGQRVKCDINSDCQDYVVANAENPNEFRIYLNEYACIDGSCASLEQNAIYINKILSLS